MTQQRLGGVALLFVLCSYGVQLVLGQGQGCSNLISYNELPRTRPPSWAPYLTTDSVAAPTVKVLSPSGGALVNITFQALPGVSSDMMAWFFQNLAGSATLDGVTWSNWLLFHPRDMVSIRRIRDGTSCPGGVGARYNAKEFLMSPEPGYTQTLRGRRSSWLYQTQSDYEFEIVSASPNHITTHYVVAGLNLQLPLMELTYSWTDNGDADAPEAYVFKSQRIGLSSSGTLSRLLNAGITSQFGCRQTLSTIVDRDIAMSIQAIGNLAKFLPAIYANRPEGSDPCFP